jgi:glycosyltransferase involved in cell wall biosynthesis
MVSLVVATFNRTAELERLLQSLDAQTYKDFEVIVVDQNSDDRLVATLRAHPRLKIRHRRSSLGVSRARNVGIREARGEVIAFPDDDCWYPPQLLSDVVKWLNIHPELDGLMTATRNESSRLQAPKFPPRQGPLSKKSVLQCAVAFNTFLRARTVSAIGLFREDIGPGTSSPYQSGEDLDYMIRPVELGKQIFYQPALTVHHPDFKSRDRLRRTMLSYSVGVGYILRLHNYSLWCFGEVLARSLCGSVIHLFKGDVEGANLYLLRAAGQFRGYTSRVLDTQRPE